MKKNKYGDALVDKKVLDSLELLWTGPLTPDDLEGVEQALRAFLLSKRLIPGQEVDNIISTNNEKRIDYFKYTSPFEDHLLDYEFIQADEEFFVENIQDIQANILDKTTKDCASGFIREIIKNEINSKRIKWEGYTNTDECLKYDKDKWLDRWLTPSSNGQTDVTGITIKDFWKFVEYNSELQYFYNSYLKTHHASDLEYFINMIEKKLYQAVNYYVSCHRSGMLVFSNSLTGKLCNDFVFSKWPQEIFSQLDGEYQKIVRELRGPGFGIELPPVILIVLTIANSREDIPKTIVDLRDEYSKSREELWRTLTCMWEAPTLKEQIEILNMLQSATAEVLPSVTGNNVSFLSIGLDLATLSASGVAAAGQKLLGYDEAYKKVSAMSFTKQIRSDLINNTGNVKEVLERHLSTSERKEFGYL